MSLGYPQHQPLQYNPFAKTSFGFGSNALQNLPNNPFPNATDYAKVIITVDNTTHWDDSGHIQTAEVGTAVSTYSSETFTWEVEGERNDVETILADLVFYPPAYQPLTDWRPTALKENVIDGNYANEEPVDTASVPATFMEITVYNSSGWVTAYDIHVDAVDPVYNNPRPYFSSFAQAINIDNGVRHGLLTYLGFDNPEGQLLPLDLTIENADEEELLEVKAEFIRISDDTQYTGTGYGEILDYQDVYVGGKKGVVQNTSDKRFCFVGKKAECNAFLENLDYTTNANIYGYSESSFFIRTSVSDGQVGSYVDTLIWNSKFPIRFNFDIPEISYVEETTAYWDLGQFTFYNLDDMAECDVFSVDVILTFENATETGFNQFYTTTTVENQLLSIDTSTSDCVATLTITDSDPNVITTALRNLVFQPKRDFAEFFDLGVQFNFSSTEYPSQYSSSVIDRLVRRTDTPELTNHYITYNIEEGVPFNLNSHIYPMIVHPFNDTFRATVLFYSNNVAQLWSHQGGHNFLTQLGNNAWEINGTRDQVNFCIQNLYLYHNTNTADNESNFNGLLRLERQSPTNDLYWDPVEESYWTFNVSPEPELTMPSTEFNYREDNTKYFDFEFDLTDTASLYAQNASLYDSHYRVEVRTFLMDGSGFIDIGLITSQDTSYLTGYGGTTRNGGAYYLQGNRNDIENALSNMKFIPNVDLFSDFNVRLDLYRIADNKLLKMSQRTFRGEQVDDYQNNSTPFDWEEDKSFYFDSNIRITDEADENPDYPQYQSEYQVDFRLKDINGGVYQGAFDFKTMEIGSLTSYVNWNATTGTFQMVGSKSVINNALSNMRFVPNADQIEEFIAEFRIERLNDNVVIVDYTDNLTFNSAPDVAEYRTTIENVTFYEDAINTFNSGVSITDEADENPDLPHYQSGYKVDLRLLDTSGSTYTNGYKLSSLTTRQNSLTSYIDGTDTYQMIGSKSAINYNLQALKFIAQPHTFDNAVLQFKITRMFDNKVLLDFSDYDINLNGINVPEFSFDNAQIQFVEDSYQQIDLGLRITDLASDNVEYPANVRNTTYTVDFRLRYIDNSGVEQDFTDASFLSWDTRGTYTSGGYPSNTFSITGSKDDINYTLQNDIRIYGFPDVLGAPNSSGSFYIDFFVTRNYDNSNVDFPVWTNSYYNYVRKVFTKAIDRPELQLITSALTQPPNTVIEHYINADIVDTADTIWETGGTNASYTLEIAGLNDQTNVLLSGSQRLYLWTTYPNSNNEVTITNNGTNHLSITGDKISINNCLNAPFLVATEYNTYNKDNSSISYKLSRTINGNTVVLVDFNQYNTKLNITFLATINRLSSEFYYEDKYLPRDIIPWGLTPNQSSIPYPINEYNYYYDAIYTGNLFINPELSWLTLMERLLSTSALYWDKNLEYEQSFSSLFDVSEFPYNDLLNTSYSMTIRFRNNNGQLTVKDTIIPSSIKSSLDTYHEEILSNNDYLISVTAFSSDDSLQNMAFTRLKGVLLRLVVFPEVDYNDDINMEVNIYRDYDNSLVVSESFVFHGLDRDEFVNVSNTVDLSAPPRDIVINEENEPDFSSGLIIDDSGEYNNVYDIVYKLSIRLHYNGDKPHVYLSSSTVDGSYFAEDYADFDDYVVNTEETFWGRAYECNEFMQSKRLKGIADTSLLDNENLGNIRYSLQRYTDGGNTLDITWLNDEPYNELFWQYDIQAEHHPSFTFSTPDLTWSKTSGTGVVLTAEIDDVDFDYMTILDAYDESNNPSLYKVILTSSDTLTYYDSNGVEIINGIIDWDTKQNINNRLQTGVTVYGSFATTTTVDVELQRKTNSGNESTIWTGSNNHIQVKRPDVIDRTSLVLDKFIVNPYPDTIELHNRNFTTPGPFTYMDKDSVSFKFDYTTINGERKGNFDSHTITPTPPSHVEFTRNEDDVDISYEMEIKITDPEPRNFNFIFTGHNENLKQDYNFNFRCHTYKDGGYRVFNDEWGYYDTSNAHFVLLYEELGASGLRHRINSSYFSPSSSFTTDSKKRATGEYTVPTYPWNRYIFGTELEVGVLSDGLGGQNVLHADASYNLTTLHNIPNSGASNFIEITQFEPDFYVVCANLNNYTFYTQSISFVDTSTTPQTIVNISQTEVTDYNKVRAMVSDDKNTIVVLKTDGVDNKMIVHGRNQGGTNNWGVVASDTFTSTESFLTELDPLIYVEDFSNQEFFNGTDTVVTNSGRLYKKDHGGTDNWGLVTTLQDESGSNMDPFVAGMTLEGIFAIKYDTTSKTNKVYMYDPDNGELLAYIYDCGRFEEGDHVQVYGEGFYTGGTAGLSGWYGYYYITNVPSQYQTNRQVISDIRYCKNNNVIYFTESNYADVFSPSQLRHVRKQHLIKLAPK